MKNTRARVRLSRSCAMPSINPMGDASLFAPRFCVVNLGCKVNRVEADALTAALLSCGCKAVEAQDADLVIVNTCTVTGEAEKKARKAVRRALSDNAWARVVATGCAASLNPDEFLSLDPRVEVLDRSVLLAQAHDLTKGAQTLRVGDEFRTRVQVKVQDGCDHACTYCIVHTARGPARSEPFESICDEVRAYMQAGVKEIVLAGIDIGSYNWHGKTLATLLHALVDESMRACQPGEYPCRIRLSSIEPQSVDDDLISLLESADGVVCRHLHLPLQSGSTNVLNEMGRLYTAQDYLELVDRIRARVPSLSLSTDVIVGFPGETNEDFEKTCELSRTVRFSRMHIFPYSPRAGTPAATRADQVPAEVKTARAKILRAIAHELAQEDKAARAGTTELAVAQDGRAITESYHEVECPDHLNAGELFEYRF